MVKLLARLLSLLVLSRDLYYIINSKVNQLLVAVNIFRTLFLGLSYTLLGFLNGAMHLGGQFLSMFLAKASLTLVTGGVCQSKEVCGGYLLTTLKGGTIPRLLCGSVNQAQSIMGISSDQLSQQQLIKGCSCQSMYWFIISVQLLV